MPANLIKNSENINSSFSKIVRTTQKENSGYNLAILVQIALEDKKESDLKDRLHFEAAQLVEFSNAQRRRELTLAEALIGTAAKLNLFINACKDYATLHDLDIFNILNGLEIDLEFYYSQCKYYQFNKYNRNIESTIMGISNMVYDMREFVRDNSPSNTHVNFQEYANIMQQFLWNGAQRIDIYAKPNPAMTHHTEEQQENIQKTYRIR